MKFIDFDQTCGAAYIMIMSTAQLLGERESVLSGFVAVATQFQMSTNYKTLVFGLYLRRTPDLNSPGGLPALVQSKAARL